MKIQIQDKTNNVYCKSNPALFDELVDVLNNSRYFAKAIRFRHLALLNWINSNIPALADSRFSLYTKIFWIINNLTDFPKCAVCGKIIDRNVSTNLRKPKYKYCSLECAHKSPEMPKLVKQTKFKLYGNETFNNREKFCATLDSISAEQKHEWTLKRNSTILLKYGHENAMQCKEFQDRARATRYLKNNGKWESKASDDKRKKTFAAKYGVDNNMKSQTGMAEYLKSIRAKYNDDSITSVSQIKSINDKRIHTFNERLKDKAYRKHRRDKLVEASNEKFGEGNYMNRAKAKSTTLQRYGVEFPLQLKSIQQMGHNIDVREKAFATKRRNGTFNTSKPEEESYKLLCEKFGADKVVRQYKSSAYLFNCDFYIKPLDLYVECNFSWVHGKHWFDPNNESDQVVLAKWKAKGTSYYNIAVKVWTEMDPKKKATAEANGLNYLAFWTLSEFKTWFSHLKYMHQTGN